MNNPIHSPKYTYQPGKFFTLDFVLTWVPLWLAVIGIYSGWFSFNLPFMLIASISAAIAALVMVYSTGDSAFTEDFWDRVVSIKRIEPTWWLFILLFLPVINILATLLSLGFDHSVSQLEFNHQFLANPIVFLLLIFLYGPLPEELGWRGYGIDSLRSRFNLLEASLILSAIWAFWHIPLFFLEGSYQNKLMGYIPGLIAFFVALIPAEIMTDWLFYRNNRSTLAAICFHFSINLSGEILQLDPFTKVIQSVLLLGAALFIVWMDRELFIERKFSIRYEKASDSIIAHDNITLANK